MPDIPFRGFFLVYCIWSSKWVGSHERNKDRFGGFFLAYCIWSSKWFGSLESNKDKYDL